MSIIEKAASRLEHTRRRAAPALTAAPALAGLDHAAAASVPAAAQPREGEPPATLQREAGANMQRAAHAPLAAASRVTPDAAPGTWLDGAPGPAGMGDTLRTGPAAPPMPPAPPTSPAPPLAAPRARPKTVLDLGRMQAMGLITEAGGRTALVEDFRIIKRPVLKRAFGPQPAGAHPGNLVMISSALPGEGKTYCSVNLALSIATELDHTVLLVDADVARPSVLKALGLQPQPGLMDLLLDDQLDLADVLMRTNIKTLSILAAGTANPRATELLASQAMQALVLEIAHRYPDRIVIFDSPPLLLTSESSVLAGHMGQIVLVVESEQTTQHAVLEALRRLDGCHNISLIYNKSRDFANAGTYDYYYA